MAVIPKRLHRRSLPEFPGFPEKEKMLMVGGTASALYEGVDSREASSRGVGGGGQEGRTAGRRREKKTREVHRMMMGETNK